MNKVLLFTGLTFFIDWSLVGLYLALGGKTDGAGMALLAVFYMFVPMLAAIWVQKRIFRQPLAARWASLSRSTAGFSWPGSCHPL